MPHPSLFFFIAKTKMPFLSFLKSESEGQSSDPAVAAAPSSEEHPLPKSLDEDGDADAVTKAIGTLRAKILFFFVPLTYYGQLMCVRSTSNYR